MGYYVKIGVMFPSNSCDIPSAKELIEKYKHLCDDRFIIERFFDALVLPTNHDCGAKGEMFSWGIVGNYTDVVLEIIDPLKEFFMELYEKEIFLFSWENMLFFEQGETEDKTTVIEVSLNGTKELEVTTYKDLPFSFGGY